MNWEYIIIGILFIAALLYMISKFYNPFAKKENIGCSKGCGCNSTSITDLKKEQNTSTS